MESMMKVEVMQKLSDSLNEEKFTRATLSNYTVKNFSNLDHIITEAKRDGMLTEIRDLCTEHLLHTPTSIAALYPQVRCNDLLCGKY